MQKRERFINFRPVLLSALFLIFGILFSYSQYCGENAWWLLLVLAPPFFISFFAKKKLRATIYALVFCCCFFIGAGSFTLKMENYRDCGSYYGVYTVTGRVVETTKTDSGHKVLLSEVTIDGNTESGKLSAYLLSPYSDSLRLSDRVELKVFVRTDTALEGEYGFRAEEIADDIRFYASDAENLRVTENSFDLLLFLRERMTETAYACMDGQTAAVTVAMLLGDTSGVEEGLLQNIRYGGIAHIFAVSGLHIGAVFLFCTLLFKNNRLPRWIRFFLVAALVLLYGGVCGYSASVVRAIVTCLTLYACKLIGLKYDPLESLSLAALITFAAYPTLLFGVGAQLSFAACAGIALLKRGLERVLLSAWTGADKFVLQKIFKRPPPLSVDMFSQNQPPLSLYTLAKRSVCSFLGVTLSAQVLTAPVLYLSFGYFSPISVLLNMVFVPLVSAVFCILLALVLIACLLPTAAGAVLLYVPNVVWAALLIAFEAVDFSALITMGTALPIGGLIAYFCAAAFCTDKFNVTRKEKAGYALLFAAALIVCMIAANV